MEYGSGPWLTHTVLKRSWDGALYDLPPELKGELLMVTLVERHRELAPVGARLLRVSWDEGRRGWWVRVSWNEKGGGGGAASWMQRGRNEREVARC
jgi:hypothetical protein